LSDAVKQAVDTLTEAGILEETLIIVSADHSHVFTIAGYPQRGNNILGKVIAPDAKPKDYTPATDNKPYTTLSYANGAGFAENVPADGTPYTPNPGRLDDMTDVDTTDKDFHQQSLVPFAMGSETHAGEDVAIYAGGPMAHLFHGTVEQNVIFHVMKTASGL
jgi:alkaline phosphatase